MPTPIPFRLQRLFVHTCDIYEQNKLAVESDPGDIEAADETYQIVPAFTGVPCYYEPTPEALEPQPEGLTRNVNFLTLDKWHFLQSQTIFDTWIIQMTTKAHPYYGRCWIVQGNGTMNASAPGRNADSQWVYAKLSPSLLVPAPQ